MDGPETLADRGEAALIDAMVARLPAPPAGALGIGDDAALIPWPSAGMGAARNAGDLITAVDLLIEGVHFRRATASARDVGWKALAVNLSDLAAMGCEPRGALVGLAAPGDLPAAWVEALYDGLGAHGLFVAGGDTTGSPGPIMIAVTVFGTPGPSGRVLTRDQARPGDVLFVTGTPGRAAAGLACLEDPALAPPGRAALVAAQRAPVPQLATGRAIAALDLRVALMDDSDGLGRSAQLLAAASGVRITLDATLIPLEPGVAWVAAARGQAPLAFALAGGEDYHLVGTCARADWPALAAAVPEAWIGGLVEAGAPGAWLDRGHGPPEALAGEMGHAHFARTSFPPRC